jgi:hypothetical protein
MMIDLGYLSAPIDRLAITRGLRNVVACTASVRHAIILTEFLERTFRELNRYCGFGMLTSDLSKRAETPSSCSNTYNSSKTKPTAYENFLLALGRLHNFGRSNPSFPFRTSLQWADRG